MTDYTKTTWVNGGAPPISSTNLNKIEDGVDTAHQELDGKVAKVGDTMSGDLTFSGAQKIIGGTGTTSDLTLQTTSGIGASGADIHFLVGNNGATEAMTILNNGNVGTNVITPNSTLHNNGSFALPISTKTNSYTLTANDHTVTCDALNTAFFVITLPTAVGIAGRVYTIKKIDSSINMVAVDGNGSETIDGGLSQILSNQWESITVQSDGANWIVI